MTDINEDDMITNAIDPLILEIYLYNNNYKDRLLITELKERAHTVRIPGLDDTSFFVKVDDMYDILHTKFKKDLVDFDSTPYDALNQSVTSIFFIDNMIRSFSKMRYFRINVSESQIYSRKIKDSISFDYRIIHTKVDLSSICAPEFLAECKMIFKNLGYYRNDPFDKTPYFEVSVREFLSKLRMYLARLDQESEEATYILNLQLIFGTKLEKDNSIALIVVEK